jgi:hypothetical protein
VPWIPELFSAPAFEHLKERRRRGQLVTVPYFAGLLSEDVDALIGSFAGEPELHDPVRGRIRGAQAFAAYAAEVTAWLEERQASVEHLGTVVRELRGVGEAVVHLDGGGSPVDVPVAIVADRQPDLRIDELRVYHSTFPLTGRHAHRAPLLQPDPELREPEILGEYQRARAAGDLDAIVACFEPGGYAREPAGPDYVHGGPESLREFYSWLFSNGGGIPLQQCTLTHDERTYALEYNVVRWGQTELPPQAGIAVYVRGDSGRLAAARIYDDVDPPPGAAT